MNASSLSGECAKRKLAVTADAAAGVDIFGTHPGSGVR